MFLNYHWYLHPNTLPGQKTQEPTPVAATPPQRIRGKSKGPSSASTLRLGSSDSLDTKLALLDRATTMEQESADKKKKKVPPGSSTDKPKVRPTISKRKQIQKTPSPTVNIKSLPLSPEKLPQPKLKTQSAAAVAAKRSPPQSRKSSPKKSPKKSPKSMKAIPKKAGSPKVKGAGSKKPAAKGKGSDGKKKRRSRGKNSRPKMRNRKPVNMRGMKKMKKAKSPLPRKMLIGSTWSFGAMSTRVGAPYSWKSVGLETIYNKLWRIKLASSHLGRQCPSEIKSLHKRFKYCRGRSFYHHLFHGPYLYKRVYNYNTYGGGIYIYNIIIYIYVWGSVWWKG